MKEMFERQREFDRDHGWYWPDRDFHERITALQYGIIALTEELGEVAGPVKKLLREWERDGIPEGALEEAREEVSEELVDLQIYLIKLADLLNVDLEEGHRKKVEKNRERFGKFKVEGGKK